MKFPSTIADIMSSPVVTADGNVNVRDAALLMSEKNIGSIIVEESGQPVGIVTERDLLERVVSLCKDPCETMIRDIMTSPLITTRKDEGILEAIREMRRKKISRLVVMEDNKTVGVVSVSDIIQGLSIASLTSFSTLLGRRLS